MYFAPQRCDIFADRNLKNGSGNVVVCAFWLANVLHSGVPFLQIATWKMAPGMWWFVHFDLQMCFTAVCHFCRSQLEKWLRECGGLCILTCKCASQRCAIFADRNLKNGSENLLVYIFWVVNVFCATAACHFSFLCWRPTSASAALASLLFEYPELLIIEKIQRFATFLTFGTCISSF